MTHDTQTMPIDPTHCLCHSRTIGMEGFGLLLPDDSLLTPVVQILIVDEGLVVRQLDAAVLREHNFEVYRSTVHISQIRHLLHVLRPAWIVAGPQVGDEALAAILDLLRVHGTFCPLAMLGTAGDSRRCDRWLRRGCRVYLPDTVASHQFVNALRFASDHGVLIVDASFMQSGDAVRRPVPRLTRRQREVLQHVRTGLYNTEIASQLGIGETTVEYHITTLLNKLGARNRAELVERSITLGM
jgi:DNA-binding NarL/FixJ family response regulator